MKKLALIVLILNLTFNVNASIPEGMPQSVYDGIVAQVMADEGHYDAVKVEEAISQWLLDQPVPPNDGVLVDAGSCSDCAADSQGTIAELPQPRNVKIKAKQRNNGTFTTTYKIKWKRPRALASDSPYAFSHYNVFVSKDGSSYETLEVTPKIKRNGRPKKKNKIKFKESQEGDYTVQVQAIYVESETTQTSNKSLDAQNKAVEYLASGWTNPKLYSIEKFDLRVSDLTGKLKDCVIAAGYTNSTLLKLFTKLDCRNSNLVDSDIVQIEDFYNLRSLIIDNNTAVTDISPLRNLAYLTLLSLEYNTNINLDFSKIIELEDLYLGHMELTALPDLSDMPELEFLDLTANKIRGGFNKLPDSLTVLVLDDNKIRSCDGLEGITIETISLSGGKLMSIDNCSLVSNLLYLDVEDAKNLDDMVDINNTGGYCMLSINNSDVKKVVGSRPINILRLEDNKNLKSVNLIKKESLDDPQNIYPDLIPQNVSLSGSNALKCSNYYNKKGLWDTRTTTSMSVSFDTTVDGLTLPSPTCFSEILTGYLNAEKCKPNEPNSFKVYTDEENVKRYLTWNHHDDAELWGSNSLYYLR